MAFAKRTFMGKGKVYIGVAGSNNLQRIGNVSKLTLAIEEEIKELGDYESAGGGVADSVSRIKSASASLTLHSLNKENLAIAIFGSASAVAGSTVTNEAHVSKKGALLRTAKVNPTTVLVSGAAGTPVYVANTDYIVTGGGIYIPDTSSIADETPLEVDYTYGAQNVVEALTNSALDYTLVLDGINEADSGKPCVVDLWRIKFSPAKGLDLIADDFAQLELEGKILSDETRPGGTSKYFRYTFV